MPGKKKSAPRKSSTARRLLLNTTTRVRFFIRLSIAIALLGWSGWCTYLGIDSTAWPCVTGIINEARVDNAFSGHLLYSYQVGSKLFTFDNVRFGDLWCLNSVGEVAGQYQSGSTIPVLYCPQNHAIACLLPGYPRISVYIPLGIGFFFLITAGGELRARNAIR